MTETMHIPTLMGVSHNQQRRLSAQVAVVPSAPYRMPQHAEDVGMWCDLFRRSEQSSLAVQQSKAPPTYTSQAPAGAASVLTGGVQYPEDTDLAKRVALFIIDPQVDFHEGYYFSNVQEVSDKYTNALKAYHSDALMECGTTNYATPDALPSWDKPVFRDINDAKDKFKKRVTFLLQEHKEQLSIAEQVDEWFSVYFKDYVDAKKTSTLERRKKDLDQAWIQMQEKYASIWAQWYEPKGSLAVPGSHVNAQRIADAIYENKSTIGSIVVSLDAHHINHIANPSFWERGDNQTLYMYSNPEQRKKLKAYRIGDPPDPFTTITHSDVKSDVWRARDRNMREWAAYYTTKLEEQTKSGHTVWPEHCIVGTPGQAVVKVIMDALTAWTKHKPGRTITWVLKGQNNKTEMYSALKAEVPVPEDASTELNTGLMDFLAKHKKVFVCGQAMSHCVNLTYRDLAAHYSAEMRLLEKLVLLQDCTSPVTGFKKQADDLLADIANPGSELGGSSSTVKQAFRRFRNSA